MTPERDERPRPQYGEYAEPATGAPGAQPEGSDHIAPSDTATSAPSAPPVTSSSVAATSAAPVAHATQSGLPGVPHNLGVKGTAETRPTRTPQLGEPYRAAEPTPPNDSAASASATTTSSQPYRAASPTQAHSPSPAPRRTADRIITIALLAIGGYFALSMAFSLSQFSAEFAKIANDLGLANFTAPPQVQVIGTVGAILVLSLYALVLIFSIRRLRAKKVTFWAPLAAGVLAWVIFFVLFAIALSLSTELWQALMQVASDPEKAQQLLDQLSKG